MKRIIITAAVLLSCAYCFSQNESKIQALKKNIEKSDQAINDPKKSDKVKTWLDRGKLFYDAYNINVGTLRSGMPTAEANIVFLQSKPTITPGEDGRETYEYSKVKLYFKNGLLEKWEETDPVVGNPLDESIAAYQRAKFLDVEGKNEKKINDGITSVLKDYETRFFNEYSLTRYVDAYNTALKRIDVCSSVGITDTTSYFFAGFTAYIQSTIDSTMWTQAIDYLEKALSLEYREYGESQGQIYHILYACNIAVNDPEKALYHAKTGFEKHPAYTDLMYDLINHYLKREENALALEYLEEAVSRDPSNTILLFAQGKVLDELGETEKSIASYDAAIAINPNYFDPYFNKAVTYHNYAVKLIDKSNELANVRNFTQADALADQANEEFYKAIEPMEKALELRPDDKAVMDILRSLYLRLRNKYPELEAKYVEMDKKLKEMQ